MRDAVAKITANLPEAPLSLAQNPGPVTVVLELGGNRYSMSFGGVSAFSRQKPPHHERAAARGLPAALIGGGSQRSVIGLGWGERPARSRRPAARRPACDARARC